MTPGRDEVRDFQKSKWLQINETFEHIKALENARTVLLQQAEDLADSIGVDTTQLIRTKLTQSKTLRKIIEYAQKTDSFKLTL